MILKYYTKEEFEIKLSERVGEKRKKRRFILEKFDGSTHYKPLIINRTISRTECPWLLNDLTVGTIVHGYPYEMGIISLQGIAVSIQIDEHSSYVGEVPINALERGF